MEDLKTNIQAVENKIIRTDESMRDLRRLQEQISTKTTARSTYFTLQQQQYAALSEENEGKHFLIMPVTQMVPFQHNDGLPCFI